MNGGYTAPPSVEKSIPSIIAWKNDQISVEFNFARNETAILAISLIATNISLSNNVTDFVFQAAVPKQLQIQISPASGSSLPPGGVIQQQMKGAVFYKDPNFDTKFDPLNDFLNDKLHIILQHLRKTRMLADF